MYGSSRGTRTGNSLSPSDLHRLGNEPKQADGYSHDGREESHTTEVHGVLDAILLSAALFGVLH